MTKPGHATVYIDNDVYENIPIIDSTVNLPIAGIRSSNIHISSRGLVKTLALQACIMAATATAEYGENLIYDERKDYKPSKGKKNKFDRLNAIYSGQRNKRK